MPALICGSLAFDTITTFGGRFAEQILPEQVHILNVSFLVPTLRREFGGCAGNIAYTLSQLGGEPLVLAALGSDGAQYLQRLAHWGVCTDHVRVDTDHFTAQAIIITDSDNNQITAFHPGAMQSAQLTSVPHRDDIRIAIIAPDGRDAMIEHAQQLAAAKIPFVFDPGQGLPMFDGEELQRFVAQATWVASEVLDPTGCGDAFRGALLYGLERGWPLQRCVELGNRVGALKIASRGGQNHQIDRTALGL